MEVISGQIIVRYMARLLLVPMLLEDSVFMALQQGPLELQTMEYTELQVGV